MKRRHRFGFVSSFFATSLVVLAASCGEDSTTPPTSTPDSGTADTAEPEAVDVGSGTKWSDLYRDMFGPTGRPGSCSFQAACHGTAEGDGAKSGSGIECFDQKTCRQSFFDKGLIKPSDSTAPENASLFNTIRSRKPDGGPRGFMPKEPSTFFFPAKSVERMQTWIRDGMKDD